MSIQTHEYRFGRDEIHEKFIFSLILQRVTDDVSSGARKNVADGTTDPDDNYR